MNPENELNNEEKGLQYLEKAAGQHNNIVALSELGNYYFRLSDEASGEDKSKYAQKSLEYFEKASRLGDNQATYWIGIYLEVQILEARSRLTVNLCRLCKSPRSRNSGQYR